MKKKAALLLTIVMMFSSFSCACNSQERGRRDRHKDEKSDEDEVDEDEDVPESGNENESEESSSVHGELVISVETNTPPEIELTEPAITEAPTPTPPPRPEPRGTIVNLATVDPLSEDVISTVSTEWNDYMHATYSPVDISDDMFLGYMVPTEALDGTACFGVIGKSFISDDQIYIGSQISDWETIVDIREMSYTKYDTSYTGEIVILSSTILDANGNLDFSDYYNNWIERDSVTGNWIYSGYTEDDDVGVWHDSETVGYIDLPIAENCAVYLVRNYYNGENGTVNVDGYGSYMESIEPGDYTCIFVPADNGMPIMYNLVNYANSLERGGCMLFSFDSGYGEYGYYGDYYGPASSSEYNVFVRVDNGVVTAMYYDWVYAGGYNWDAAFAALGTEGTGTYRTK